MATTEDTEDSPARSDTMVRVRYGGSVAKVTATLAGMAAKSPVLASVQAQFPKSAGKNVRVVSAWRREDSTLDAPQTGGNDGWTGVNKLATYGVLKDLQDRGFTIVNLSTTGVAWGHKDVAISHLI